jgi:hypothetical protein
LGTQAKRRRRRKVDWLQPALPDDLVNNATLMSADSERNPRNVDPEAISDQRGRRDVDRICAESLIAVFIVAAVQLLGTRVCTVFNEVGASLK